MQNVKINYKFAPDYGIISPTDAYGGMNPKGKLIMHLFTDVHSLPESETRELDKDGNVLPNKVPKLIFAEEDAGEKDTIYVDRIIQNTVTLTPNNAIEIAFWMIDSIVSDPANLIEKEKLKEQFLNMIKNKGD